MTCLDTLPPPPLAESCIVVLETKRLILRAPRLVDAKAVAALANDRRIAENAARIPHPYRQSDAERWIAGTNIEPGALSYLVTLSDGPIIGSCRLDVDEGPAPDLSYWLGTRYWGKGYATEVARVALGYGFDTLELDLIFAITLPDNHASQAVMKRLGLTYRRRVEYRGLSDSVWFDIDRETWKSR